VSLGIRQPSLCKTNGGECKKTIFTCILLIIHDFSSFH
jgi:hypothetical protein